VYGNTIDRIVDATASLFMMERIAGASDITNGRSSKRSVLRMGCGGVALVDLVLGMMFLCNVGDDLVRVLTITAEKNAVKSSLFVNETGRWQVVT
jgi:hypothetical protein